MPLADSESGEGESGRIGRRRTRRVHGDRDPLARLTQATDSDSDPSQGSARADFSVPKTRPGLPVALRSRAGLTRPVTRDKPIRGPA